MEYFKNQHKSYNKHNLFISASLCYQNSFIYFTGVTYKNIRCCMNEFHIHRGCKIVPIIQDNVYVMELEVLLCNLFINFVQGKSYIPRLTFESARRKIDTEMQFNIIHCYPKIT